MDAWERRYLSQRILGIIQVAAIQSVTSMRIDTMVEGGQADEKQSHLAKEYKAW